ncbi:2-oxoacid:acceptor oxidoreductase subunit alpha [Caldicoprobacter faecalis]|uniref:2-oxoglutarate ferredoxin oxidoreductase subunit alpha n=1 Tax=Caldicoprobacter faecalis TaxID=937334 RepID=A0A1I5UXZ6_9FIRM|nr:2-oxoacid:acceptor oxidoreductase subunit alpha [Caldicoprobacter faecalis]SFQ00090.1 2-oxoglutarate ferredoxin oxidoreductase subunit alpha [Caldicoprobacter faecalis]
MDYSILIGGAAGQGVETLSSVFEKVLQRNGFKVFSIRDYMSRVRGGHNFVQIRFGDQELFSHADELDGIIALNEETVDLHIGRLKADGFVICDKQVAHADDRVMALPLMEVARRVGNARVSGSAALGAALALLGISATEVEAVYSKIFRPDIARQNAEAVLEGSKLVQPRYNLSLPGDNLSLPKNSLSLPKEGENILINGNQAIALGALAAGCKFYSAYPMTPSTSIMNYLASKMMDAEIVVEQAEDEIAAINMAIGASYAGARAMTGTSGGGFSLMVEGLGLAGMLEVPLVIVEVQRPGPVTGFPTRTEQGDLKFVISASQGEFPRMVIAPRNAEDAFYQTVRAFNLADKYQIPVILLSDQFLADSTVTIKPFDFDGIRHERYITHTVEDKPYKRYKITPTGVSPRVIPGKIPGVTVLVDSDEHDEYGHITESADVRQQMVDKRLRKLEYLKQELQEPWFLGDDDFDVLILAWGSTWGPLAEAVSMLNSGQRTRYAALVFGDVWPLPTKVLVEKAKKAKKIINVEQNATGQLASLVAEVAGIFCDFSVLKYDGRPMSPRYIFEKVREKE